MAARTSMSDLISTLRGLTGAGTADYSITGGTTYWSDEQLQAVLDRHVSQIKQERLEASPTIESGGAVSYYDYQSRHNFFEAQLAGTPVTRFLVLDETYATLGTAAYTVNYERGSLTFGTSTGGASRYVSGYSYDLNGAASDVWSQKASHYALAYDVSTDNHSLTRSQLIKNCLQMAKEYGSNARARSILMERGDC